MLGDSSVYSDFSRKLSLLLWSDRIAPFFWDMECGWNDGGCHTLARILAQYLRQRGYKVSLAAVIDEHSSDSYSIRHVVAEISLADGCRWYLDANGVQTATELLSTWERYKGKILDLVTDLSSLDDLVWLEFEVPTFDEVEKPMVVLLQQELEECPF